MTDVSRLISKKVTKVVTTSGEAGLQQAIREAVNNNLNISIAGARHSQGGHTFYDDAVVLDMTDYNEIVALDIKNKIITVQSGATWAQIQEYIQPYKLAVGVMQSSNIFTVGGSLSSNVHGRDLHKGPIIETIRSFRLLNAQGEIIQVSREENSELFGLVIGGFGLFGVILEVDIQLTDDEVYKVAHQQMDYQAFPRYINNQLTNRPEADLMIARLSLSPKTLLEEMYVTSYIRINAEESQEVSEDFFVLKDEQHVERNKLLFGIARKFDWGKSLSWHFQTKENAASNANQLISRNNAMRSGVKFIEHTSSQTTDLLQEYFVPRDQFSSFIDELRTIVQEEKVNLLNASVRYLNPNKEAHLSYAHEEGFAIVILVNQRLTPIAEEQMKLATQKMVDAVLRHDGTYYLTYQLYPSTEQMKLAYPNKDSFFEKKRKYDEKELFKNLFYERYSSYDQE